MTDASAGPGAWSPDGNWFVYASIVQPLTLNKVRTSGLAEPETLKTGVQPYGVIPSWSPRNDWILYYDPTPKLISLHGSTTRDLPLLAICAFGPGGGSLYCVQVGAVRRFFEADLEGKTIREIGSIASEHAPGSVINPGFVCL